ncbi:MAG TPA: hypothetical protein VF666_18125 [Pyrinomonadaceae bacterium]|jgi:hypothetical protein
MNTVNFQFRFAILMLCALLSGSAWQRSASAQGQAPLTSDELVRMVRQLPTRPSLKEEIIKEIRRRGIGFPLTTGLRSVVATKSGNDADLRRTLEEAERRRLNPAAAVLPSEAEGEKVLAGARAATIAAAQVMPDFVVRQQIVRSAARGATKNWWVIDRLTVAVSYRANAGEQYRVLAVNGLPQGVASAEERHSYEDVGGSTSTGEYVTRLAVLFNDESQTKFQMVDTDSLRGRRAIVYEFEIKRENSKATITYNKERSIVVGNRGRIWVDRETFRVLRMESISTEIEPDFPVTASSNVIDYDWVTISERQYLLPIRSVLEMTALQAGQTYQTRNDIRFRNYQKYGSEVRIIDDEDDIIEDEPKKDPPKDEPKPKP